MKLLHIIASMDPASGGPCQGIRNSNPEIKRFGISREVVSLDDPNAAFLGQDDFIIHPMGPSVGPWQYSAKLKPWLLANLSRFDVVVINGLWIYPSFAGWSAIRQIKKRNKKDPSVLVPKVFVMPHGMLDPYFQQATDRKIKAVRNWIYWKLVESKVVNDADALLFTCETELLLAREAFSPYRPKKEINVGYGIIPPPEYTTDMRSAFVEYCPQIKGVPYLLFLSRIHKKKGVDILIKAYAEMVKTAATTQKPFPRLVVAGPGIKSLFGRRIMKMMRGYPELKDRVIFPGMLSGDLKWGALYGCDAFILPSHQENFGIAVVEALACEKAVLISEQVNIWREILEGGGGITAADTYDGALKLLEEWLTLSKTEQLAMGRKALQVYQNNFHTGPASAAFIKSIGV